MAGRDIHASESSASWETLGYETGIETGKEPKGPLGASLERLLNTEEAAMLLRNTP